VAILGSGAADGGASWGVRIFWTLGRMQAWTGVVRALATRRIWAWGWDWDWDCCGWSGGCGLRWSARGDCMHRQMGLPSGSNGEGPLCRFET